MNFQCMLLYFFLSITLLVGGKNKKSVETELLQIEQLKSHF